MAPVIRLDRPLDYGCNESNGWAMKRITLLAGILGLAVFLSGCDKCGNFSPLFGPYDTKSCSGKSTS